METLKLPHHLILICEQKFHNHLFEYFCNAFRKKTVDLSPVLTGLSQSESLSSLVEVLHSLLSLPLSSQAKLAKYNFQTHKLLLSVLIQASGSHGTSAFLCRR